MGVYGGDVDVESQDLDQMCRRRLEEEGQGEE
jgi:hypothetical protein